MVVNPEKRQIFSFRKLKAYGMSSALLGMAVASGQGAQVYANEMESLPVAVDQVSEEGVSRELDHVVATIVDEAVETTVVSPSLPVEIQAVGEGFLPDLDENQGLTLPSVPIPGEASLDTDLLETAPAVEQPITIALSQTLPLHQASTTSATVVIDDAGLYRLNGVATRVKAQGSTPLLTLSHKGTYVLNYVDTGIAVTAVTNPSVKPATVQAPASAAPVLPTPTAPLIRTVNGRYVLNGQPTLIAATNAQPHLWISPAGTYVLNYVDTGIKVSEGGRPNVETTPPTTSTVTTPPVNPSHVTVASSGYYTVNGVVTKVRSNGSATPLVAISPTGTYLINYVDTGIKVSDTETKQTPQPVTPLNWQGLTDLLSRPFTASDYSIDSWQAYATVLAEAKDLLNSQSGNQAAIDQMVVKLLRQQANLGTDKTALTTAVALPYRESDYSSASWATYQAALAEARRLLADAKAKQGQLDQALVVLTQAQKQLGTSTIRLQEVLQATYLASDYSASSWQSYEAARQAALGLLDSHAPQSDLDQALIRLEEAIRSLGVDRTGLSEEVAAVEGLVASDYSRESWQAYETKLAEARRLVTQDSVKQSELIAALSDLQALRQGLSTDKSALESAIALAFVETHYSPDSWAKYQDALVAARLLVSDRQAKQSQLAEAEATLRQAIEGLTVDKATLLAELDKVKGLIASDYSEASWRIYQEILAQAQAVDRLVQPSQSAISQAVLALRTAREQLTTDTSMLTRIVEKAQGLVMDTYTRVTADRLAAQLTQIQQLDIAKAKQSELNRLVSELETALAQLVPLKVKPTLVFDPVTLTTDTAALSFQLTDPDKAYVKTTVAVYQGERLIETLPVTNLAHTLWQLPETETDYRLVATLVYDRGDGEVSELVGEQRLRAAAIKHLELKDISKATLYAKSSDKGSRPILALDSLPERVDGYYVKVDSERFKQIQLKVTDISAVEVDGQEVYRVTASLPELSQDQDQDGVYETGYRFYVAKKAATTQATEISSFKQLVDALTANPTGQFVLTSDVSAEEVDLSGAQPSYITTAFKGSLTGSHAGKQYAIYGLKAALFDQLEQATVSHLDLKEVDITLQNHLVGALARQTTGTTVTNVAVSGDIDVAYAAGLYDFKTDTDVEATVRVGGLVGSSTTSRFDNVSFEGNLTVNTEGVRYKKKNPTDGFYYYHYVTQQTGGILGQSLKDVAVKNARVSADIAVSAANDHTNATYIIAGGIIGNHNNSTTTEEVTNLYAEGTLVNQTSSKANIGGLVGQVFNGKFSNLVTAMDVTGGHVFVGSGKHIWQRFQTPSVLAVEGRATGQEDSWGSYAPAAQTDALLSKMTLTATTQDSQNRLSTAHDTLYSKVTGYQELFAKAYENIELLLPFYNKEYIVKLGNTLKDGLNLVTKKLLSVTPRAHQAVVSDVSGAEDKIDNVLLNYEDGTIESLPVRYLGEFKHTGIAEYAIADTDLLYTPDQLMRSYDGIVSAVLPELSQMAYLSDDLWMELGGSGNRDEQLEKLYLKDSFNQVQGQLESILRNVLGTSTVYGDTSDVAEYILKNKAALMLGLSYISRWYNIDFGDTNIQNIAVFQQDFFGKPVETLEWLIGIGSSGYQALNPVHNDLQNSLFMGENSGTTTLKDYLEAFRQRFATDMTASAWFYNASKAHIVEADTIVDGQVIGSTDTYDKLFKTYTKDAATYDYSNMILPLLTVSEDTVYLITTMEGFEFGSHESYVNQALKTSDPSLYAQRVKDFEETVRTEARHKANHWANWYAIANADVRDKLMTGLPTWDNFMSFSKSWSTAYGEAALRSVKEFFGPTGTYMPRPSNSTANAEAFSDGSTIRFVLLNALNTANNRGGSVWTHEQVHNWDGSVYLSGYGRRTGLGSELFAEGLLQSPRSDNGRLNDTLGLNLYSDVTDPALSSFNSTPNRLRSQEDLKTYMHGVMDVLYVLDYAQAMSIRDLSKDDQRRVLNKLEVVDRDATRQYDSFRPYTDEEWQNLSLNTIEDFVRQSAVVKLNHYRYGMGGHGDEGQFSLDYLKVNLFSPFYSLNQNDNGVSGGYTIRRAAYELLADQGYEAFVAYLSDRYKAQAQADGVPFSDTYILSKIFEGRYEDFDAFKVAKFEERIAKLNRLKPVTFSWRNQTYTISTYAELKVLMDQALAIDLPQARTGQVATTMASYQLKKAIYDAYLKQTANFTTPIFNE